MSETHLAPKRAPRFARCGENRRALAGQMQCENPRISEDFVAFPGCCGKGGLERVKGIEPSYSAWEAAALPLSYTRAAAKAA